MNAHTDITAPRAWAADSIRRTWDQRNNAAGNEARSREIEQIEALEVALAEYKAALVKQRGPIDRDTHEYADVLDKAYDLTEVDGLFERACEIRNALEREDAGLPPVRRVLGSDDPRLTGGAA